MTRVKESPLLGILLGLCMTMVVQSSSATIALLQNVARQAGPDGIHERVGPCRGGAGPSGRQHRHDGDGPAGLHRGRGRTLPALHWPTAASTSAGVCWRRCCCPGSSGWWSLSPPKARSWKSFPGRSPTPIPPSTSAAPCSGCLFCRGWCGWCVRWCRKSSPLSHAVGVTAPPRGEPLACRTALSCPPEVQYGVKDSALLPRLATA